ncbi:MAG: DsrE family protein [Polynucleobacter victoriensis]|jgi:intracellular sulfur oxidation DsrE/DsrF family protein
MNNWLKRTLVGLGLGLSLFFTGPAQAEPVKVVYHLSEGIQQASRAIGNIRNHLNADPTAKIVVVTHGAGIDFLLEGAENMSGVKFAGPIGELASRGVEFKVCNNTLEARKIPKEQVVLEAKIVPSGVAEVANLQFKQKYAYLRP